jgi:hypothetical protein
MRIKPLRSISLLLTFNQFIQSTRTYNCKNKTNNADNNTRIYIGWEINLEDTTKPFNMINTYYSNTCIVR